MAKDRVSVRGRGVGLTASGYQPCIIVYYSLSIFD